VGLWSCLSGVGVNPVNLFKLCANFGRTAVSLLRKILGRCPYYVVKIVPAIGRLVRSRIEQIFDALPDFWIFDVSCRGSFKLLQNLRLCFVLGITLRRRRLQTMALAFQTSEFIENCQHDPPSGDQGRQLGGILTRKFPMQSPSGGDKGDNRCLCNCGCQELRSLRGHARCTVCDGWICHKCRGEGWSEPFCHVCSWGTADSKPLSEESLQAMRSSRRSRAKENLQAMISMSSAGSGSPPGQASESSASAANIAAPEIDISADVSAAASALPDEQDIPLCSWCGEHIAGQQCASCSRPLCGACVGDGGQCGVCDPWFGQDPRNVLHGGISSQSHSNIFHLMTNQQYDPEHHTHWVPCTACGLWMGERGLLCSTCSWHVHIGCTVRCTSCDACFCTRDWPSHVCPGKSATRDMRRWRRQIRIS